MVHEGPWAILYTGNGLSIDDTFVELQLAKWVLCSWSAPRDAMPESLSGGNLKTSVLLEGSWQWRWRWYADCGKRKAWEARCFSLNWEAVSREECVYPAMFLSSIFSTSSHCTKNQAAVPLSSSVPNHSRSIKIAWKWKINTYSVHMGVALLPTRKTRGIIVLAQASQAALRQLLSQAHHPHSTPTLAQEPFLAYFCLSRAVLLLRRAGGDRRAALAHCPSATRTVLAFPVWDRPCKINSLTALSFIRTKRWLWPSISFPSNYKQWSLLPYELFSVNS